MTNTRTKTPTARPVDARESLPKGGKVWLFNSKTQQWALVKAFEVRVLHKYSSERIYWAPLTKTS